MTYIEKLKSVMDRRGESKNSSRIVSELCYLDGISKLFEGKYNEKLEKALDFILEGIKEDGVITAKTVTSAEEMLSDMQPIAKSYKELFISHAHIDMNWMWGYNETASVTIDTFRTVLKLMEEYPEFTFMQSQASTYEIIEKYAPEMLPEIKKRVHEGRWEVTAAEWVEPDKNMPSGESLTRQILQAKKYLSGLLEIPADSICINFVPDTFGHNASVPEILSDAGVKYMYHCRGTEGSHIYNFVSPSGKKTLNYREFRWYNGEVQTDKFELVPDFCQKYKVDTYICVYGVGDHGGGPSRRDIEHILEYKSWPLTPDIKFGTMREFFETVENSGNDYPEFKRELNCLFTGCYTTQSRIKMANRISEARIGEAEMLCSAASVLAGAKRSAEKFDSPWRNILFNHFHDILPGSGTVETREYAMGKFQETLAAVNNYASAAMRSIAAEIDTSSIPFDRAEETISEGAGVGYFQEQNKGYSFPSTERGRGRVRAFHLFNTTEYDREETAEILVWDYYYDVSRAVIKDKDGKELPFIVLENGTGYWGHRFVKIAVRVRVPAFAYTTVVLSQKEDVRRNLDLNYQTLELVDEHINDAPIVMENKYIKAVFDRKTVCLISLTDKETGESLIDKPSCFFTLIDENARYGMTSWRVGTYMKVTNLNESVDVRMTFNGSNHITDRIHYEIQFGSSVLKAGINLKKDSRVLEFKVNVDWNEAPVKGQKIPQLSFAVPVSYKTSGKCRYDIPYGIIERPQIAHDVPALSYLGIGGETKSEVGIITDTKYGYRCYDDIGSVTLIRSAYDPDPYPERGIHDIKIGVAVSAPETLGELSERFNHPISYVAAEYNEGTLPLEMSAVSVKGDVKVSCIKNSEDGLGETVRLYDVTGTEQSAEIAFAGEVKEAFITDSNENIIEKAEVKDGRVKVSVAPYSVLTVKLRF